MCRLGARGGRALGRRSGRDRRHRLRCHLLAGGARRRRARRSPSRPAASRSWDTIVWLDHRAVAEAEECTASGHRVLDHVGGVMSPEMEIPKLMWLKRHLPETWARAGLFLDLADYLTWRASGSTARSECTVTCKWTYLAHEQEGWQAGLPGGAGRRRPARARWAAEPRLADRQRSRPAHRRRRRGTRPDHRLPRGRGADRRPCRGAGRAGCGRGRRARGRWTGRSR